MSSTVTAKQVETLNHALKGFGWLKENHSASIESAEVEVDGDVFTVKRDWNLMDDGDGEYGVLVVEFG